VPAGFLLFSEDWDGRAIASFACAARKMHLACRIDRLVTEAGVVDMKMTADS
jgi:hypothetical protein